MESWQKGRGDLFEELTKVCNRIERDIASELNESNTTRIGNGELRLLRESSDQVERLTGHNTRLAEELDRCRVASSRVEVLEEENKRLAETLSGEIQQRAISTTPAPFNTPVPSRIVIPTPGFTSSGTENTLRMVPWEQHKSLIDKYNRVCENWADLKASREQLERLARSHKQNAQTWRESYEEIRGLKEKKDVKYKKLKEEAQDLRARLNLTNESFDGVQDDGGAPIPSSLLDPVTSRNPITRGPMAAEVNEKMHPSFSGSESMDRPQDCDKFPSLLSSPRLPINYHHRDLLVEDTEFESIEQSHTSSTQENSDLILSPRVKTEPSIGRPISPDIPIVISARSVKKRKQHGDNAESTPVRKVKIEILSSSPLGIAGFQHSNDNESIDLDDIGEKVDTPKKQQRTIQLALQDNNDTSYSPQLSNQGQNRGYGNSTNYSESRNSLQITPKHRTALQLRSTNVRILPRTSAERPPKKRRIAPDKAVADVVEDSEFETAERMHRHSSELSDRLFDLLEKPSPKSPVINAQLSDLHRSRNRVRSGLANEFVASPHRDYMDHTLYGRRSVRVSGSPSRPSSREVARNLVETPRPTSKGSLRGSEHTRPTSKGSSRPLLDPPRPLSNHGLLNQNDRQSPSESRYFTALTRGPNSVSKEFSPYQSVGSTKPSPMNLHFRRSNVVPEIDPDEEPLRVRPLNNLSLRDFKVNPNYNQGYKHAFTEVVRGAEARKCLQGCTRPDCCGPKFRALAEISRNPNIPRTLSQKERDDALLEEFMGGNAYKIENMSKAEKEEALLQAQTRDLANKFGRHRHAYERKASPPGFWRVDFPTTQEQEEDREKAKQQERETVAQRYAEAMRPGGAYIFRDE